MESFVLDAHKNGREAGVSYPDTHIYNATKAPFRITHDEGRFWELYCETAYNCQNPCISEIIPSRDTLVQYGYDINLEFDQNHVALNDESIQEMMGGIDQYVKGIIANTQTLIQASFKPTNNGLENIAVYLVRPLIDVITFSNGIVQFRAKIIFPYLRMKVSDVLTFHKILLGNLQLYYRDIVDFLVHAPTNNLRSILTPINTEYNILYGSSDTRSGQFMVLRRCYQIITDAGDSDEIMWENYFDIRRHRAVQNGSLKENRIADIISRYGMLFWLPLFFSREYNCDVSEPIDGALFNDEQPLNINMKVIREAGAVGLDRLNRASRLVGMLNPHRFNQTWCWLDIGSAIHHIDSGIEGLKLWKWGTVRGSLKDTDDCDSQWYTFNGSDGVTGETLEYFARQDDRAAYEAFVEKDINDALTKAIYEQEDIPIASAFKACFPFDFACVNYDIGIWYYYENHRWNPDDGVAMIMTYITDKFVPRLEKMLAEVTVKYANVKDKVTKGNNDSLKDNINALLKKLNRTDFNMKVCRALRQKYHNRKFNRFADLRAPFTACPNGVIDLRGGDVFRPGKPEDYLTKVTGCCYPESFTWDTLIVRETMTYMRQVFRSEPLREYVLRLMGSLLYSGNNDKLFPILVGDGDNSKSMFVRLIESALGSYAVKLPYVMFTEKKKEADKPTPLLIHSRGAKVAFLQEPNKSQPIQSGTVKEFTGHDTIPVRDLFERGSKMIDMEVTVVPFLITNQVPQIPDCQRAIWERTKMIVFSGRWSKDAPIDVTEQYRQGIFPMDNKFDTKIPKMAPAMLWIMVQKYKDYDTKGLIEPQEVVYETEKFRISNNKFIQFCNSNILPAVDENGDVDYDAKVHLDEVFDRYKRWYKDQEFKERHEAKSNLKELAEMVWHQKADAEDYWHGFTFKVLSNQVFGMGGGSLLL